MSNKFPNDIYLQIARSLVLSKREQQEVLHAIQKTGVASYQELVVARERMIAEQLSERIVDRYFWSKDPEYIGKSRTISSMLRAVPNLLNLENIYRYGDSLVEVKNGKFKILATIPSLQAILNKKKDFITKRPTRDSPPSYGPFPDQVLKMLPSSEAFEQFKSVIFFGSFPVLAEGTFELLPHGYNEKDKVYVLLDKTITPSFKRTHIDELLHDFCFQTNVDRANALGFLITECIRHHETLRGRVPAINVEGNRPGLGKGELVQSIVAVHTGRSVVSCTLGPDDVENEKRFCSVLMKGQKVLFCDNIKNTTKSAEISSPCLERSITDPMISFRILGQNNDFTVENTIQVYLAHNGGVLSKDIVSRSVDVFLFNELPPSERSFSHADIRKFAQDNRLNIAAEILGMWEVWKQKGMPRSKVKHRMTEWAKVIGGVLEANGIDGFLGKQQQRPIEVSVQKTMAEEVLKLAAFDQVFTASELFRALEISAPNLYVKFADASILGKLLTSAEGEVFNVGDSEYVLTKNESQNKSFYKILKCETSPITDFSGKSAT
jgi:hypothetical protein